MTEGARESAQPRTSGLNLKLGVLVGGGPALKEGVKKPNPVQRKKEISVMEGVQPGVKSHKTWGWAEKKNQNNNPMWKISVTSMPGKRKQRPINRKNKKVKN